MWTRVPALILPSPVLSGLRPSLLLSGPQFPHLENKEVRAELLLRASILMSCDQRPGHSLEWTQMKSSAPAQLPMLMALPKEALAVEAALSQRVQLT